MSNPVHKTPKGKTASRRSHHALKGTNLRFDKDGNPHLPHHEVNATSDEAQKRAARRARRLKKIS